MAVRGHDHAGGHEHGRSFAANRKALGIAIAVTVSVMVVEAVGGWLSNSLALLSDAGHMFTDVLALVLSLVALHYATRPTSASKTYGFYRMEILAALANGTALILISLIILYEAYQRFTTSEYVDSQTMIVIAAIGLAANGAAAFAMMKSSGESLNIRGAYLHILSDTLSSFGVIVGGAIIWWTGWYLVDPIISVLICVVILRGAFVLVKESVNILLEAVPSDLDVEEMERALRAVPGVQGLHDIHLWTITSGVHAISAHLLVDDMLVSRAGQIQQEAIRILKERFGIAHTTIQLECQNCQEGFYCDMDRVCVAVGRGTQEIHGHG
jgi:cobalt-zinc-cadmium efflux system protein